jgi:putative ABC transport system ATP-binding protein
MFSTTRKPMITASRTILEVTGVKKTLGSGAGAVQALKGVDLELKSGELTLMMGPSGSGKTTLLSIIGCILNPTEGHIVINGKSTSGLDAESLARVRRDHVGFVFQAYNLFPTLTAAENIMLALDVRGVRGAAAWKLAHKALDEVGLSHRARAYPGQLSGGQKQRVGLARALAGKPSVILADEPTAALDAESGKAAMELLARVAKDTNRAVLAVTHDHRTLAYADRIIRIEDGLIVGDERPKQASGSGTDLANVHGLEVAA